MRSNAEIRQKMDLYRTILLVVNWIVASIVIIAGLIIMFGNALFGILAIIIGILAGIIAHFIINVSLAIPFILLNNGDILESIKSNTISNTVSASSNTGGRSIVGTKLQKKCTRCKKEIDEDYTGCPHCGNRTFE